MIKWVLGVGMGVGVWGVVAAGLFSPLQVKTVPSATRGDLCTQSEFPTAKVYMTLDTLQVFRCVGGVWQAPNYVPMDDTGTATASVYLTPTSAVNGGSLCMGQDSDLGVNFWCLNLGQWAGGAGFNCNIDTATGKIPEACLLNDGGGATGGRAGWALDTVSCATVCTAIKQANCANAVCLSGVGATCTVVGLTVACSVTDQARVCECYP